MKLIQCHSSNYRVGRTGAIQYIVVHYTANNGDTATDNGNYFQSGKGLGASAHYFVDENEAVQSVSDKDTAWHCGATNYAHKLCRNGNSIGVELCSRKDGNGNYYFKQETMDNATELIRNLMKQYQIPLDCVIRHYDVTHKNCPAPLVDETAWVDFKSKLVVKKMTFAEAKAYVKEKYNLDDNTMLYLEMYRYGKELIMKLAV